MVRDCSSTDSGSRSLGDSRRGGSGGQAAVDRVKELVVGASHQTAPCSGHAFCGPRGGQLLPSSSSLSSLSSPSGLNPSGTKRKWRWIRGETERRDTRGGSDGGRETRRAEEGRQGAHTIFPCGDRLGGEKPLRELRG